jgi:glycosyltransferase involved in cell wall biosynthesis
MQDHLMPLVSIGLPTYNRVDTLRKSIVSALNQSYKNIEIIISDNASTDETERVCREYAATDPRITYIRQSNNIGPTPNFLAVLERSRGEYFMWLCDDDWIDDTYVEQCTSLLLGDPHTILVGGVPKNYSGSELRYVGTSTNILQDEGAERMLTYYNTISDNGIYYGVWRRAVISNIPLTNTIGNDWHQLAAAAYCGKIQTVDGVYIHRSLDGSTVSFAAIAEQMELPYLQRHFPYLSIALNASIDIFGRVPIFRALSITSRALLAFRVSFLIVNQYIVREKLGSVWRKIKKFYSVEKRVA